MLEVTGGPSERRAAPGNEAPGGAGETPPGPGDDASRKGTDRLRALTGGRAGSTALRTGVVAVGLAACGLLVAGELSPVYEIQVNGLACEPAEPELAELCAPTGAERHTFALLVLAVLGALMSVGAGLRRSAPAAGALTAVGVAALAIVLIGDAPDVNETGVLGLRFDQAEAEPASGFWLSLVGGALALLAGVLGLLANRRPRR